MLLESIHNFRDAGGLATQNGAYTRKGLIYRSGDLADASSADLHQLSDLGIKTIIDLRTRPEAQKHPDRIPAFWHVQQVQIPIKVSMHNNSRQFVQLLSHLFGKAQQHDYAADMLAAYREYVTNLQSQFAQVLKLAADQHNLPLLIHCTAGKDRTGFACSLIQRVLGVPQEHVMQNYLLSNSFSKAFYETMRTRKRLLSLLGGSYQHLMPMFEVQPAYLQGAYDQIDQDYGSIDSYLLDGQFLVSEELRQLQLQLLETPS